MMFFTESLRRYRSIHVLASLLLSTGYTGSITATDFGMFATSPLSLHPVKTVSSGSTFTVSVGFKIQPDSSISSYSMSMEFDTDLDNELDIVSISQPASVTASGSGVTGGPLAPSGTPIGVDSTASTKGSITSFAGSTTPGNGIINNGSAEIDVIVGTITFQGQPLSDGADAFVGFFDASDHVKFDSGATHSHITFGDLSVNLSTGGSGGSGSTGVDAPSIGVWGLGTLSLLLLWLATRRIS